MLISPESPATRPYAVTFAGVPGSSKSIVSHYLSEQFGLPIYSTDNIRFEVREDFRADDINQPEVLREYERRSKVRRQELLARGRPVILDCSMDRSWPEVRPELEQYGYDWFMIGMELSRDFLIDLYVRTGRKRATLELDGYLEQHQAFTAEYGADISLSIHDEQFPDRMSLSANGLRRYLASRK